MVPMPTKASLREGHPRENAPTLSELDEPDSDKRPAPRWCNSTIANHKPVQQITNRPFCRSFCVLVQSISVNISLRLLLLAYANRDGSYIPVEFRQNATALTLALCVFGYELVP